ncbi:hypothetical protein SAMN05421827_109109 [Pedobacter terrae]|uniref:Uncharacterized protein n=1 Tax=Pedobacter terrae TaxID=405671 RepID=A0A1G7W5U8_9SPHI|nr:hypothetical protein [Pedobacter terrae]SDG67251.1 hypothetical protein SAMN05421827_109109 [Pedobacter terrae]
MEKLQENTEESKDSALIKSLGIAFPEAKVQDYGIGFMFKITAKKVDPLQFRNLVAIAAMYSRDVDIIPSHGKIVITLSESDGKGND